MGRVRLSPPSLWLNHKREKNSRERKRLFFCQLKGWFLVLEFTARAILGCLCESVRTGSFSLLFLAPAWLGSIPEKQGMNVRAYSALLMRAPSSSQSSSAPGQHDGSCATWFVDASGPDLSSISRPCFPLLKNRRAPSRSLSLCLLKPYIGMESHAEHPGKPRLMAIASAAAVPRHKLRPDFGLFRQVLPKTQRPPGLASDLFRPRPKHGRNASKHFKAKKPRALNMAQHGICSPGSFVKEGCVRHLHAWTEN